MSFGLALCESNDWFLEASGQYRDVMAQHEGEESEPGFYDKLKTFAPMWMSEIFISFTGLLILSFHCQ